MSGKIRRSAGSHTPFESWLHRAGLARRDPAGDLVAFNAGQRVKLLCLTTLGTPRARNIGGREIQVLKGGWLHVARGQAPVWRQTGRHEEVVVPAQAVLAPSDRRLYFSNQVAFRIATPKGEGDLVIRQLDLELLSIALTSAGHL